MQCSRSLRLALFAALCFVSPLHPTRAAIVATGDVDPDPETTPWTMFTTAYVGKTAEGTLTADSGSDLDSKRAYIGHEDTATGEVTVSGPGSTWTNSSDLHVGNEGSGTLNITAGGTVRGGWVFGENTYVGYGLGSTGAVTVDGAGSTWEHGWLAVGREGSGTLSITDGAAVSSNLCHIGFKDTGAGVVTVDGVGSTWTNDEDLYVGREGSGTLNITGGAAVGSGYPLHGAYSHIAWSPDSRGVVNVDGPASTWTNNESLDVGYHGAGALNITNGAAVSSTWGQIGYADTATGVVTVDGPGSSWSNDFLKVGGYGSGTLNITGGATVRSSGWGAITTGVVTVDGDGSTWTTGGHLYIGRSGNGTLDITNGAAVTSYWGHIGHGDAATGVVTVDGAGATWANGSNLYVGLEGSGTLNIANGAAVTAGRTTYVAFGAGSTGAINFGPGGGTLTTRSLCAAPAHLTGTGTIYAGGLVSDVDLVFDSPASLIQTLILDSEPDQNITVHLDMTGPSSWRVLGAGFRGSGSLTIRNGVYVGSDDSHIGYHSESTGVITVDGAGSTWTNSWDLYVGRSGSGTLNITNGAAVIVKRAAYVAFEAGSTGTINFGTGGGTLTTGSLYASPAQLTGTGTINTCGLVSDGDLVFDSPASLIQTLTFDSRPDQNIAVHLDMNASTAERALGAGFIGSGSLTIRDGASVGSASGYVGYHCESTGVVEVDGVGSTWANGDNLYVGYRGSGTLNIINGAAASSVRGRIGYEDTATGVVTVDGAGSTWTNDGYLHVGDSGSGTLKITDCGAVSNDQGAYIGYGSGSTGEVTVDGAGSTWTNSNSLSVGGSGSGALNISGGAVVCSAWASIGTFSGSTGVATVDGAGSTWTSDGYLGVGSGTLSITDGATVSSKSGRIAFRSGSPCVVTVDGAGSTWTNSDELNIGRSGDGTLYIRGGATVSNGTEGYIGDLRSSTGVVAVDGAGSTWTSSGDLYIGREGSGTLSITSGAAVSNHHAYLGDAYYGTGVVTVDGAGSTWTNSGDLCVGKKDSGTLNITNGAAVSNGTGLIGYDHGEGVVSVDGTGSTWTSSGDLCVGFEDSGILNITNGAAVSNHHAYLGKESSSSGVVTVDGAGSTWMNSGDLYVGHEDSGTLSITNGAAVSNGMQGYIGYLRGSSGVVTVDGAGSTWTSSGDLYVGFEDSGALSITNGAVVGNHHAYLGNESWSSGVVTIHGAGSTWTNSGDLHVGREESGTLKISDGGRLNVGGDASVGIRGVLEIGLGNTHDGALIGVPGKVGVGGQPPLQVGGDVDIRLGWWGPTLTVFVGSRLTGAGGEAIHGDLTETIITAAGSGGVDGTFRSTPRVDSYLGNGVWFGNNKTGEGVIYVGAPGVVTRVDVAVFQAKAGDCDGDRTVSFADFNDLANNYTGALDPGVGEKEWRQGDLDGDADVDFGDFNDLANNYTGAGVEYGPGKAPAADVKATPREAELIVYLADVTGADGLFHAAGDVVLSVGGGVEEPGVRLNGYEVYSAGGLLVPDADAVPQPFLGGAYMEESSTGIVVFGGLSSPLHVSGHKEWTLGWEFDAQAKATPDIEFSYGTGDGVISGNVLYVVPEPATIILLLMALAAMVLLRRKSL